MSIINELTYQLSQALGKSYFVFNKIFEVT